MAKPIALRTPEDMCAPPAWTESDAFPVIAPPRLPCIARDGHQGTRDVLKGDRSPAHTHGDNNFVIVWMVFHIMVRAVYDTRVERDAPVNTEQFLYIHQMFNVDAVEATAAQGRFIDTPLGAERGIRRSSESRASCTAQRALHDWHHDGHELCLGDLGVATCWAAHARVGTLPSGALVLPIGVPAVPVVEMSALGHVPPDGILPDRPQADGTRLLFLRGRAELLPHVVASEPARST